MPTRRDILLGSALGLGGAALGFPALAGLRAGTGKRVVLVTALGGWDTTVTLDPKRTSGVVDGPDLDEDDQIPEDVEATTTYGTSLTLGTNDHKRPDVSAFFDAWGSRSLVVRGLDMGTISHLPARGRILTGSREETAPDLAALVADRWGRDKALPYVDLGSTARPGPFTSITARTGAIGQARFLMDRSLFIPDARGGFMPHHQSDDAMEALADAWHRTRWGHLQASRDPGSRSERLAAWGPAQERAVELAADGKRLAGLLPDGLRVAFSDQADAAVSLLKDGVAWCVALDSALDFDTHDNVSDQHDLQNDLFAGLHGLVQGLSDASLLDDTVVLVLSEFGRTPRRNSADGKDHWPITSALMLGGGIAGGRVWGGTDDGVAPTPVDLATGELDPKGRTARFEHFAAGLLAGLDVDPEAWLPGVEVAGGLFA